MRRWEIEVGVLTGAPIMGIGVIGSTRVFEAHSSGSSPGSPANEYMCLGSLVVEQLPPKQLVWVRLLPGVPLI